jgi:thioredoxin-related protein
MKKIIIVLSLALLTLSANFAHSEELNVESDSQKIVATDDYVLSLLTECNDYAKEDEISESDMTVYLLSCINEELESGYYLPIKVLPKVEVVEGEPK